MTDSAHAALDTLALDTLQLKPVLGQRVPLGKRAAQGIIQPSVSQPLGRFTPSPFHSEQSALASMPLAARFVGLPTELGEAAAAFQNFVPELGTEPGLPITDAATTPATRPGDSLSLQAKALPNRPAKQQSPANSTPPVSPLGAPPSPTSAPQTSPPQTSPPQTSPSQTLPFNKLSPLVRRRPLGRSFEPAVYSAFPLGESTVDDDVYSKQGRRLPSPSLETKGLAIQSRADTDSFEVPLTPATTDKRKGDIHRRPTTSTDNVSASDAARESVSPALRQTSPTLLNPATVTEPTIEEQSLPAVALSPEPAIDPNRGAEPELASDRLPETTPQTRPDLAAKTENTPTIEHAQPPEDISKGDLQTEYKAGFQTDPELQSQAIAHEAAQIDAERETQIAPTIQPKAIIQPDTSDVLTLKPDAIAEVTSSIDRDIQTKDLSVIEPETVAKAASKVDVAESIDTFSPASPAPALPDSIVSPVEPAAYSALTPLSDGLKTGQSKLATAPLGQHIPLAEAPSPERVNRTPSVESDIKALVEDASIDEASTIDALSHFDEPEPGGPAGESDTISIQRRLSEVPQESPEVATSEAPIMRASAATALAKALDTQAEPWFDSSPTDQNLSTAKEPWQTQFSLDPVEARADHSADPVSATTDFPATPATTLISPLAQPASDTSISKDTQSIQMQHPDRTASQNDDEELLDALAKVLYGELRSSLAKRRETELGKTYYLPSWQMLPTHQEPWPPELHQLLSAVKCQVESKLRCDHERAHYDPPLLIAR